MAVLSNNKRAFFDYEILQTVEAGILLLGTEVKSVRAGHMSLQGSFVTIHDNEAYITNATIPPWQVKNAPADYEPTRSRKLLIRAEELKELIGARTSQGLTIVPLRVYTKGPSIKVSVGLARGKKQHSKKEVKRERDIARETARMLRGKEDV